MNNHVLEPSELNVHRLKDFLFSPSVASLAQGHLCARVGKNFLALPSQNAS